MSENRTIAVIPARGGSKRIPKKNIKNFLGKPLITYSIENAIKSSVFDDIFVSTDDLEIARISEDCGAKIPFLRTPEFSSDHVMTVPVIANFLEQLEVEDSSYVCCIYPTAPLLNPNYLIEGLDKLKAINDIDYVIPITKYHYPIQRALREVGDNKFQMAELQNMEVRSQDLEPMWHDAGMFYWAKSSTWKDLKPMLNSLCGVKVPTYLVQDIDDEEDWVRAELLFKSFIDPQ